MEDTVFDGAWWRFSAYELRDGYIRPKRRAKLARYEPPPDFQVARNERKRSDMAHATLINLVARLKTDTRGGLDADSRAALLGWCSKYGLLGLLLHQVHAAHFAPHWEPRRPANPDDIAEAQGILRALMNRNPVWRERLSRATDKPRKQRLCLTQQVYNRTAAGTFQFGELQHQWPSNPPKNARPGSLAKLDQVPERARPMVVLQELTSGEWRTETLATTWGGFFPAVPTGQKETYGYPKPYSEEFWREYAEPLNQVISAATALRQAMQDARRGIVTGLNSLVSLAGPAIVPIKGKLVQRLVSPSLFGSLVIMAQVDLASGRLIKCRNERCANIVVALNAQSAYCSPQCRYAETKRRSRRRKA